MALISYHSLSSTLDEDGITLQAIGENVSGSSFPSGRPGNFDFINQALRCRILESDPITYTSQRAEVVVKHELDVTGERWYTWRVLIPSQFGIGRAFTIAQWHVDPAPEEPVQSRALNLILFVEQGQFVPLIPEAISPITSNAYRPAFIPVRFDQWTDICFHVNWQTDNTGFMELYIDRAPLFKLNGLATTYSHPTQGPYAKFGIYNFFEQTGWSERYIFVSGVSVWSGNDGYQTVMGGVPIIGTRLIQN